MTQKSLKELGKKLCEGKHDTTVGRYALDTLNALDGGTLYLNNDREVLHAATGFTEDVREMTNFVTQLMVARGHWHDPCCSTETRKVLLQTLRHENYAQNREPLREYTRGSDKYIYVREIGGTWRRAVTVSLAVHPDIGQIIVA